MSDQFRNLRHLTAHVDEQVRIYVQLQEAIRSVGGLLDSLPEKKREVEALEEKSKEIASKIIEQEAAQQILMDGFRKQRKENQDLLQKEQQERVTSREAYRLEMQTHTQALVVARQTLAEVQREIERTRGESETLRKELDSTVKAVLRR